MKTFDVQVGSWRGQIKARTGETACRKAIRLHKPEWLGLLVRFAGPGEPWQYLSADVVVPVQQ